MRRRAARGNIGAGAKGKLGTFQRLERFESPVLPEDFGAGHQRMPGELPVESVTGSEEGERSAFAGEMATHVFDDGPVAIVLEPNERILRREGNAWLEKDRLGMLGEGTDGRETGGDQMDHRSAKGSSPWSPTPL